MPRHKAPAAKNLAAKARGKRKDSPSGMPVSRNSRRSADFPVDKVNSISIKPKGFPG